MSILCGTDFSPRCAEAVRVAAELAGRLHLPLHVLHAVALAPEQGDSSARDALARWVAEQAAPASPPQLHVKPGRPDETLLEAAVELSAELVVVAAQSSEEPGHLPLGSHADRIAQRSRVPVLVVRNGKPFGSWLRQERPLRVVLGLDATQSSDQAARWVTGLARAGACEVVAVHLYWPPEQFARLGLGGIRSYVDADPEVTRHLQKQFEERFEGLASSGALRWRLEPHLGRVGDRLAAVAQEEAADLVVVGTQQRSLLERVWQGSVSRRVLYTSQVSVACIPSPAVAQARPRPAAARRVLAATDFSEHSRAAVAFAYAITSNGGTVHLVHVARATPDVAPHDIFEPKAPELTPEVLRATRQKLERCVPSDSLASGKLTELHVLESSDPARAIAQAAERLDVDVICLGTHGRSGLAKTLLGSVAESVLHHTRRPVLFTRGPLG